MCACINGVHNDVLCLESQASLLQGFSLSVFFFKSDSYFMNPLASQDDKIYVTQNFLTYQHKIKCFMQQHVYCFDITQLLSLESRYPTVNMKSDKMKHIFPFVSLFLYSSRLLCCFLMTISVICVCYGLRLYHCKFQPAGYG